jgi:hypothetical protein
MGAQKPPSAGKLADGRPITQLKGKEAIATHPIKLCNFRVLVLCHDGEVINGDG